MQLTTSILLVAFLFASVRPLPTDINGNDLLEKPEKQTPKSESNSSGFDSVTRKQKQSSDSSMHESPRSLRQLARFLNDSLACDFDELSFCRLENNGGWSFQQSLLELVNQLTAARNLNENISTEKSLNTPTSTKKRGYFVCTDRGRSQNSASSSSRNQEPARLEAFAFTLNSERIRRDATLDAFGQVLFVGPASGRPQIPKLTTLPESKETDGLCLRFDVRLSEDPASRLTVKFRSLSQTITALRSETENRIKKTTTPASSPPTSEITARLSFLTSVASRFFWIQEKGSGEHKNAQPRGPPVNQWLSFSMPLDSMNSIVPFNSPLVFSLEGQADVCIDQIHFSTNDCPSRGLTWGSNETRVFYDSLGQITISPDQRSFPVGTYVPSSVASDSSPNELENLAHLLTVFKNSTRNSTGAFLFALLLGFLAALLICAVAISLACGKRNALSAEDRKKSAAARKAEVDLKNTNRTILRSASVSSLPTATLIHPLPPHHVEDDGADQFDWANAELSQYGWKAQAAGASGFNNNNNRRRRPGCRGLKKGGSCVNLQTPGSPPSNPRLSLLLSINENNELVLVSPSIQDPISVPLPRDLPAVSLSSRVSASNGDDSSRTEVTQVTTTYLSSLSSQDVKNSNQHRMSHLSDAEAESTLAEMAASVAYLGNVSLNTTSSGSNTSMTNDEILPMYEEALHLLEHPHGSSK